MIHIISKTDFDFIGRRYAAFALSGVFLAVSAAALATRGLNYGIDFTGGTLVQVTFPGPKTLADVRADLAGAGLPDAEVQSVQGTALGAVAGTSSFHIRVKGQAISVAETAEKVVQALSREGPALRVDRKEYVGPAVGRELWRKAMLAILLSLAGIIIYVAFRFGNPVWGAAGVIALAHDVFTAVGLFALTGREVTTVIVAAFLTIAGYSINDTIVIFDRMREKMRIMRREPLGVVINASVNETLSRTIITNLTVFMVVLVLFFFGGSVLHDFAMAMVWGAFVGTYSTIAVAAPLVYEWEARRKSGRLPEPVFVPTHEKDQGIQTRPAPPGHPAPR